VEASLFVKDQVVGKANGVTPREAEMLAALVALEEAAPKLTYDLEVFIGISVSLCAVSRSCF